jgi:cellulose biosynthesis protein BcsQ
VKTLAFYNIKGGVGKTTAAVNTAFLCAAEGPRTLLWDLDPQAGATFFFGIAPRLRTGLRKLVKGKRPLAELVSPTPFAGLDVLPADFDNRHLDTILGDVKKSTKRLRRLLDTLTDAYDWVILDCPPSISLLSENVFRAADALAVPLIPTTLSLESFARFRDHYIDVAGNTRRLVPFLSMVDGRKTLHREIVERCTSADGFCRTHIPFLSLIEKMGVRQAPLPRFSPGSRATQAFRRLWKELRDRTCLVADSP